MANLSKTRTLFAFTSPRTVEKIIPEIQILVSSFEGEEWNVRTQVGFFKKIFDSPFYEGSVMPQNIPLAARDRITRAPKALGFIDLKPKIELTKVGKDLLSGKRTNEIIAKQLFKFQLPSPFHANFPDDTDFNVRPYLELLRLIKVVGKVSKYEIAIFFLQLTNYKKFDNIVSSIKEFREAVSNHNGNRKEFIENIFTGEIVKTYAVHINKNDLKTRESGDTSLLKFIKTKKANHVDYADAFIRYLRATQLISFDKKTFRVIIAPFRLVEVDYILKSIERNALEFKTEEQYKNYLFDPFSLLLLTDNRSYVEKQLDSLQVKYQENHTITKLKDLLEIAERKKISENVQKAEVSLKDYKEFDDILAVFSKIQKKEIPDPSLYLEWNIWRSMVMINYAKKVNGNFTVDLDGIPLNTALGNIPDIEIQYNGFTVIVEVTMSSGNKQYEMEGEPVARHFGNIQKNTDAPVYCLFIAPKISEGALAHFFNLNKMITRAYGGKTRIVPMNLIQFISFITIAKNKNFSDSKLLKSFLDTIIQKNHVLEDENIWFLKIDNYISKWLN